MHAGIIKARIGTPSTFTSRKLSLVGSVKRKFSVMVLGAAFASFPMWDVCSWSARKDSWVEENETVSAEARASGQIVELKKLHCQHCVSGNQKQNDVAVGRGNGHSRSFEWKETNGSGSTAQHGRRATGEAHRAELDRSSSCLAGRQKCHFRFLAACVIRRQMQHRLLRSYFRHF